MSISMNYDYPLLKKVFNHFKAEVDVSNVYLVCCQHLLEPQLRMFEGLIEYGFKPENIKILGKAYSSNKEIIGELQDRGIKVIQPLFSGSSFDEEHKTNCQSIVDNTPDEVRVVVIDDGAELIKCFADSNKNIWFAVEQTSSGFRKLEKELLEFPVINVARSATKLVQESPLIARLCFERITEYLSGKADNPKVLIVGLGAIGEAILQIFKQNDYSVSGFDVKDGHNNLLAHIQEKRADVVIGATGFQVLSTEEIESLTSDKPLHLISVSSSDREFPVSSFRSGNEVHKNVVYKNIVFVNNGFPITFKGNRNELTPVEIEKTICLLGGSVLTGISDKTQTKGLVNVAEELENLIN